MHSRHPTLSVVILKVVVTRKAHPLQMKRKRELNEKSIGSPSFQVIVLEEDVL